MGKRVFIPLDATEKYDSEQFQLYFRVPQEVFFVCHILSKIKHDFYQISLYYDEGIHCVLLEVDELEELLLDDVNRWHQQMLLSIAQIGCFREDLEDLIYSRVRELVMNLCLARLRLTKEKKEVKTDSKIGYEKQVEIIKLRLSDVKDLIEKDSKVIVRVLMMFIMDPEYSRAAILQAEKEWKKEHNIV